MALSYRQTAHLRFILLYQKFNDLQHPLRVARFCSTEDIFTIYDERGDRLQLIDEHLPLSLQCFKFDCKAVEVAQYSLYLSPRP